MPKSGVCGVSASMEQPRLPLAPRGSISCIFLVHVPPGVILIGSASGWSLSQEALLHQSTASGWMAWV